MATLLEFLKTNWQQQRAKLSTFPISMSNIQENQIKSVSCSQKFDGNHQLLLYYSEPFKAFAYTSYLTGSL